MSYNKIKTMIFSHDPDLVRLGIRLAAREFTTEELQTLKKEGQGGGGETWVHCIDDYGRIEMKPVIYDRPDGLSIGCTKAWVHVLPTGQVDPTFTKKYKEEI